MRLLVVGGTRFIGRHLVERAVDAGHHVTVFHRGVHRGQLDPNVERVLGDRNGDLSALRTAGPWDAVIDTCAYTPDQVHHLADTLADTLATKPTTPTPPCYVMISTVSVYDDPPPHHDETAALLGGTVGYGAMKARCEQAARDHFGDACLIVRPGYVVGPYDYSWRFPWWVTRLARGGNVLAPGPPEDPLQLIDGRDLAAWIIEGLRTGLRGTYHTVGPVGPVGPEAPLTFGGLLHTIASAVAPVDTNVVWVDAAFLAQRGLGPRDLPLWDAPGRRGHTRTAHPGAALRAGLVLRPLELTVTDTLRWARANPGGGQVGLDSGHELALLRAWHRRRDAP
ncbi:MAG: NAD-dependent epimerase/dehydratase family protein [Acidimicrobiales bacterium]